MSKIVILGAGPAGLTLGCYLAKAGHKPLIVDRAVHPRAHVGESLMPATVRILREIGFHSTVETGGFMRSFGVTYHPLHGNEIDVAYREFPQEGVLQDHTYHAERSRFDLMLLKHAEGMGCRLLTGAQARGVVFEGDRATGVALSSGGHEFSIEADLVVDATGRGSLLGQQLGLKKNDEDLQQFALHGWFYDVDRGKRLTTSYTHIYFLEGHRQWAWHVPINEELTSIGIVSDRQAFRDSGLDPAEFFKRSAEGNPALVKAVRKLHPFNSLTGEVNYAYDVESLCGDGWIIIGDAARFVDPIFSSGVFVAMHSAKLAAERVLACAESGTFDREGLEPYEAQMRSGSEILEEFIRLFYRLPAAFTRFVESNDHRIGVLRLLQGEVYNRDEAPVLAEMQRFVAEVEKDPEHELHGQLC